jgi:transposase
MPQPSQAELFARAFQSQVARNPGAACLTLPILRELGVATAVNASCASAHDVAHGVVVNTLALNRLQAPRPLYKVEAWLESTALGQALGIQPEQAHDTRLGETLDAIYPHYLTIWQTIIQTAVQRYRLPLDWLHYDITSVYFEGLYTESELVKFGYSRDHRPDSKQINLGLNVTGNGLPLAFRVLVGNTADRTTPRQNCEAVRALLSEPQAAEATIVHDRAMGTPETLVWYGQHQQKFITPMTAEGDLQVLLDSVPADELMSHPLNYHPARAATTTAPMYFGVWREHTFTHDGHSVQTRVLIVQSVSKARLDAQKRDGALQTLQKRLKGIQQHLNQRKYKRRDYTLEQIHLAQRGNVARHLLDIELMGEDGALVLQYPVNADKLAQAKARDGRYPLVTNRWDLDADQVLARMKEQDVAEKRFAILKGPLQVHPLWLHKDERLVSLVLVVMIALLVYCLLEHLVRQAQRHLTGRALLELFANYTVVLVSFSDGSQMWTYPELAPPQSQLLNDLGLPLPESTLMLS